ncbi:MAG: group 1 truncated hemoglobin [Myxococcota bacterium]|nr:group 1 truncated hemoglobin [Myxococcota bacterium]
MSDYDEIGEERLRAVIDAFVDRMFDDLMIGFFFRSASRERIKEMELQHAAEHLGGPVTYGGRPLDKAHAPHRIMGGHFERRKKILDDTLREHGVSEAIRERWMAHLETLRPLITKDAGSECR